MDADLLSRLVLYSNDSELVESIRKVAETGDIDAQYALGLIYAEGRGIEPDLVAAYRWLSRALEAGDKDAGDLRHIVLQQMNPLQIAEAEREQSGVCWQ
ncbi:tetratricopeptide repeat protein [Thiohalophilus sp.]|uniref:tetratricopeptide repeat protein n=1 Tax=Thiohalophilus sp. TaxID=3028392 RepID=UPI0039747549